MKKKLWLSIISLILIVLLWHFNTLKLYNLSVLEKYREDYPFISVLIFISIYALFVFSALPSLPLNLMAGFYWGTIQGGIYSVIAVTLGSWISFSISRSVFGQPLNSNFDNSWMNFFQKEFKNNGWKFIALARINPLIPTGPLNYFLGLTSVSNAKFIITTFLFLQPICIFISYIGFSINLINDQKVFLTDHLKFIVTVASFLTIFVLILLILKCYKEKVKQE